MAEIKAKYKCTQQELYAIGELGVNNLDADLLKFTAKSTNYNAAFVLVLRGLRNTAKGLPDDEQRNGVHQNLKVLLPDLLKPIIQDFRDLSNYIKDGWPGIDIKPRLEQAGLVYFNKIGTTNWEYVTGLNGNMTTFITDAGNAALLAAPGGMIGTFVADVAAHFAAFKVKYDAFVSSRDTTTATAAKLTADNNFYDACIKFMTFGVESVFNGDDAGMKRYTWNALKTIISPPGAASLKVYTETAANVAVKVFSVEIKAEGKPAITLPADVDGLAWFKNIDADRYAGKLTVNGVVYPFAKEVNVGVDARITVGVA